MTALNLITSSNADQKYLSTSRDWEVHVQTLEELIREPGLARGGAEER